VGIFQEIEVEKSTEAVGSNLTLVSISPGAVNRGYQSDSECCISCGCYVMTLYTKLCNSNKQT